MEILIKMVSSAARKTENHEYDFGHSGSFTYETKTKNRLKQHARLKHPSIKSAVFGQKHRKY